MYAHVPEAGSGSNALPEWLKITKSLPCDPTGNDVRVVMDAGSGS
jgi:hypothetical protein